MPAAAIGSAVCLGHPGTPIGVGSKAEKLPKHCVSREPKSGRLVMLTRGKPGFTFIAGNRSPDDYNRAAGLTYEQVEAMEFGALFGFEGELADPDYVRSLRVDMGRPVGPIQDPAEAERRTLKPRSEKPPKLVRPADIGNFLPQFAETVDRRQRPSWG